MAVTSLVAAFVTTMTIAPRDARPCASAPRAGETVDIHDEAAVIVWDSQRKIEHFIRRASFMTSPTTKDFGFLVPTPTKPELAEAPNTIFADLRELIEEERKTVEEGGIELGSMIGCASKGKRAVTASAPPVRILEETTVAGMDATILEADDPAALAAWLSEHGYPSRAALEEWLTPYVAAHYKITAFRYRADRRQAEAAAVRMSFAAERPFYPYREPFDANAPSWRTLRVYLVSDTKIDATLDDAASTRWPAAIDYAGQLPGAGAVLEKAVPAGTLPAKPWVTAFDDRTIRRPPADVIYAAAADQTPIAPPPIIRIAPTIIPVELIIGAIALIATAATMILTRRKRRIT